MEEIEIRECATIEELDQCVSLQRDVFGLPDIEISPRRHLIVSRHAGGWTLGGFAEGDKARLVGFVHHLAAVRGNDEVIGYSHMMAVHRDYQNQGLGARLKWAQRSKALAEGRRFIRWTWEPMRARNAHFNLNRLGVVVREYADNFYGTDYLTDPEEQSTAPRGLPSDRLIANWELSSPHVVDLSHGTRSTVLPQPAATIAIPADWNGLLSRDADAAKEELRRVRSEFMEAFANGLVCASFDRTQTQPRYLLYNASEL